MQIPLPATHTISLHIIRTEYLDNENRFAASESNLAAAAAAAVAEAQCTSLYSVLRIVPILISSAISPRPTMSLNPCRQKRSISYDVVRRTLSPSRIRTYYYNPPRTRPSSFAVSTLSALRKHMSVRVYIVYLPDYLDRCLGTCLRFANVVSPSFVHTCGADSRPNAVQQPDFSTQIGVSGDGVEGS